MDSPENFVQRIDLGIDYSMLGDADANHVRSLIELGDFQLNALCNNRLARIAELEAELKILGDAEPKRRLELIKEIGETQDGIQRDKASGRFRDYGVLKQRIVQGATAGEVYSLMPFFYAEAYTLSQQLSNRNDDNNPSNPAEIAGEVIQWLKIIRDMLLSGSWQQMAASMWMKKQG